MKVIIKKWGNSAAVRIPSAVLETARLTLDQIVEIRTDNGVLIIEPVVRQDYDIEKLLAGITLENVHQSVDFGKSVGCEVW